MKKVLLLAIAICISTVVVAQTELDIINNKGEVVKTVPNGAYCYFYGDYAAIMQEEGGQEKWSAIDLSNMQTTITPNAGYAMIEWYNYDGYGKVHTEEGIGLVDLATGKTIIPVGEHNIWDSMGNHFKTTTSFQGDDGRYYNNTKIYDTNGKLVFETKEDIELTNADTFFKKTDTGMAGPFDMSGNQLPTYGEYTNTYFSFDNGFSRFEKGDKAGLLNEKGEVILPFEFDNLYARKNLLEVEKGGQTAIINYEGEVVVPYQSSESISYNIQDDYIIYRQNDKQGMMNADGTKLTEPIYSELRTIDGIVYFREAEGAEGFLSFTGEELMNLGDGGTIQSMSGSAFAAQIEGQTGLVGIDGEELLPFEYDGIIHLDGDYWSVTDREANKGIFDSGKKEWLYDMNLTTVSAYYGLIKFEKDGLMGAIYEKTHVPPTYKKISDGASGYISAVK